MAAQQRAQPEARAPGFGPLFVSRLARASDGSEEVPQAKLSRRDALATMGALVACGLMRDARAEGRPMPVGQIARAFTGPDGHSHIEEFTLSMRDVRVGVTETEWIDALSVSIRSVEPRRSRRSPGSSATPVSHSHRDPRGRVLT